MNNIRASSTASGGQGILPELRLTFASVDIGTLTFPSDLWSERAPFDGGPGSMLPPVIVARFDRTLAIIDGCKRVRAARKAGESQIQCGIVDAPLDPLQAGLLRIELNCGRELHPHEKLLISRWLKVHCDRQAGNQQAARLGLSPAERHDYEELASCTPLLIDAVLDGWLDVAVAPEMAHLSEGDARELIALFSAISLSRQMQRELAEWLPEIAFNQKISLAALLRAEPLAGIAAAQALNAPQKAAKFHGTAHEMRFPLYVRTKNAWSAHSRCLNPDPERVSFHPAAYFEKNQLEIRIRAEDGAALHELMARLAAIGPDEWGKLIDPARIGPV
jgi:hypothetical protein